MCPIFSVNIPYIIQYPHIIPTWRFPKGGVAPNHPFFHGFSNINHPAIGVSAVSPILETLPHICLVGTVSTVSTSSGPAARFGALPLRCPMAAAAAKGTTHCGYLGRPSWSSWWVESKDEVHVDTTSQYTSCRNTLPLGKMSPKATSFLYRWA